MQEKVHTRYTEMDNERTGKLSKSRLFAKATITTLLPDHPSENKSDTQMSHPHSSLPARGLVEWAGKVVSSIIPVAGIPFLSIDLPPLLKSSASPEEIATLDTQAKIIQDTVHHEIAQSNLREVLTSAMQHVGAIGDVLIHQNDLSFTYFRVDNYVLHRDVEGNPLHIIVRKFVREEELDVEQLSQLKQEAVDTVRKGNSTFYPYYIELTREDGKWYENHYIGNIHLPDEDKTYSEDRFPYYALRYKHDPYEDWSTSLVEENYGDIISAHATRETLLEGLAIGNMGYVGYNPSNVTPAILSRTRNWGAIPMRDPNALTFVQPNNIQALSTSATFNQEISSEIRRIFLMDVANELTHDRVTAYQIRAANQAFERSSGGTLSTQKNDLLRPLANNTLHALVKMGRLPDEASKMVTNGDLELVIKSGIDAIRADTEDQTVFQFYLEMIQSAPEAAQYFDIGALLRYRAKQLGIPTQILKSPETRQAEKADELNTRVQDQLVDNIGPAVQSTLEGQLQ